MLPNECFVFVVSTKYCKLYNLQIHIEIRNMETEPVTEASTDPETEAAGPTEKTGDPMKTAFFITLAAAAVIWIAALILWAGKKKEGESK